jgi:predicted HAD superfamily Cof-like phosphohydrolase
MEAHDNRIFNKNKNKNFLRIDGTKKIPYFRQKRAKMTLQDSISAVEKFHEAFKIGNNYSPTVELSPAEIALRHRLMSEENEEYLEAALEGDIVEVADALGDMLYILCGTILKHGLQHKIEEVFQEIQRSNMSKLDANGDPIYREDGKVMKSDQYFVPNIASILEK